MILSTNCDARSLENVLYAMFLVKGQACKVEPFIDLTDGRGRLDLDFCFPEMNSLYVFRTFVAETEFPFELQQVRLLCSADYFSQNDSVLYLGDVDSATEYLAASDNEYPDTIDIDDEYDEDDIVEKDYYEEEYIDEDLDEVDSDDVFEFDEDFEEIEVVEIEDEDDVTDSVNDLSDSRFEDNYEEGRKTAFSSTIVTERQQVSDLNFPETVEPVVRKTNSKTVSLVDGLVDDIDSVRKSNINNGVAECFYVKGMSLIAFLKANNGSCALDDVRKHFSDVDIRKAKVKGVLQARGRLFI